MTSRQRGDRIHSIAVISSAAASLVHFRGPLLAAMIARGLTVHALAPDFDEDVEAQLHALGVRTIQIELDRTGMHPARDLRSARKLAQTLRNLRPDATFCYFIKPVIYGTLAACLARVPRRFALVAGLGYVFTSDGHRTVRRRLLAGVVGYLYRLALNACDAVFFQNEDDLRDMRRITGLPATRAKLTSGTGIDLTYFTPVPVPEGPPEFLFIGRILREKGVEDFVVAARLLRDRYPEARFRIIGSYDTNPGAISPDRVVHEGWADVVGEPVHLPDVRPAIARCSVFVLPSYREGKPRSTQEALAMGRAVITTDAPGCRDTVVDGVNGYLVPLRDPAALAAAMECFMRDPDLARRMGSESRILAEQRFDVHQINRNILDIMGV